MLKNKNGFISIIVVLFLIFLFSLIVGLIYIFIYFQNNDIEDNMYKYYPEHVIYMNERILDFDDSFVYVSDNISYSKPEIIYSGNMYGPIFYENKYGEYIKVDYEYVSKDDFNFSTEYEHRLFEKLFLESVYDKTDFRLTLYDDSYFLMDEHDNTNLTKYDSQSRKLIYSRDYFTVKGFDFNKEIHDNYFINHEDRKNSTIRDFIINNYKEIIENDINSLDIKLGNGLISYYVEEESDMNEEEFEYKINELFEFYEILQEEYPFIDVKIIIDSTFVLEKDIDLNSLKKEIINHYTALKFNH